MKEGDEVEVEIEKGRQFTIKLVSIPPPDSEGKRKVIMELNGERWFMTVTDSTIEGGATAREKASAMEAGSIGSPMPGVIVDVKVKPGDVVEEGDAIAVLSAMKMETVIPAPTAGTVERLLVVQGDKVEGDDLLATISSTHEENFTPHESSR